MDLVQNTITNPKFLKIVFPEKCINRLPQCVAQRFWLWDNSSTGDYSSTRQFIDKTIHRQDNLSMRQFIDGKTHRSDNSRRGQFIDKTIHRRDNLSMRQFIEWTIHRRDNSSTRQSELSSMSCPSMNCLRAKILIVIVWRIWRLKKVWFCSWGLLHLTCDWIEYTGHALWDN